MISIRVRVLDEHERGNEEERLIKLNKQSIRKLKLEGVGSDQKEFVMVSNRSFNE